jgi:hypothetical protein
MSIQDSNLADSINDLIHDPDPTIRHLALRQLSDRPANDPELRSVCLQAHQSGPIPKILDHMNPAGFWAAPGAGYNPKYRSGVWSLIQLAQLGAHADADERIPRACAYQLDHSLAPGGQFSSTGAPSGTIPCLQGNLVWALQELEYKNPRLEKAVEWMARSVTGEGVAPTGESSPSLRYYAYHCGPGFACGPNNKQPCAWGAVKILLALGRVPEEHRTPLVHRAIQQGIDFFFSVDPASAAYPCGNSPRPSSNWWKFGFPVFYITDLLQLVQALADVGAGADPRLTHALDLIREKQDDQGKWVLEYDYTGKTWIDFGLKKTPNPYVTLRAVRALRSCTLK